MDSHKTFRMGCRGAVRAAAGSGGSSCASASGASGSDGASEGRIQWGPDVSRARSGEYARCSHTPLLPPTGKISTGGFVLDTIRLTPRFTVELGVRYDVFSPATTRFGAAL